MDAKTEQRYNFNDLTALCCWYIENKVNEVDDRLVYDNEKMYCKCVEYIHNGHKFTDKQKQELLWFFNN